jgi:16S rRNA C1402 N4-methylase RsmH
MSERIKIKSESLRISLGLISNKTAQRLIEKGDGSFVSTHEALGVITEEYQELVEAIKSNDIDKVKKELLDLGVACHFSLACFIQHNGDKM